jgi:hypothetical protein
MNESENNGTLRRQVLKAFGTTSYARLFKKTSSIFGLSEWLSGKISVVTSETAINTAFFKSKFN